MKILGNKVYLNFFFKKDIDEKYINWLNDKEVVKYSRQRHIKNTYKSCLNFYLNIINKNNLFLKINDLKNNSFIGIMTYIFDNDKVNIGILIGDKNYWNKHVGLEAWSLSLQYLSTLEKIKKITAGCMSSNLAMKKIFIKSKMNFSHKERKFNNKNNKFEEFVFYGIATKKQ